MQVSFASLSGFILLSFLSLLPHFDLFKSNFSTFLLLLCLYSCKYIEKNIQGQCGMWMAVKSSFVRTSLRSNMVILWHYVLLFINMFLVVRDRIVQFFYLGK